MVFVTPTADPSLISELTGAGYAPGEREQSLLASADLFGCAQRDERIGVARDLASWARASATAFLERDELEPNDDRIALILATTEGTTALEVRKGDVIIATAALSRARRARHALRGIDAPRVSSPGLAYGLDSRPRRARSRCRRETGARDGWARECLGTELLALRFRSRLHARALGKNIFRFHRRAGGSRRAISSSFKPA